MKRQENQAGDHHGQLIFFQMKNEQDVEGVYNVDCSLFFGMLLLTSPDRSNR